MGGEAIGTFGLSRRSLLQAIIGVSGSAPPRLTQPPDLAALSPEDSQFLEDLEQASFLFFWEQASPDTGLVRDRCNVRKTDPSVVASIAATGFGLTALCI